MKASTERTQLKVRRVETDSKKLTLNETRLKKGNKQAANLAKKLYWPRKHIKRHCCVPTTMAHLFIMLLGFVWRTFLEVDQKIQEK